MYYCSKINGLQIISLIKANWSLYGTGYSLVLMQTQTLLVPGFITLSCHDLRWKPPTKLSSSMERKMKNMWEAYLNSSEKINSCPLLYSIIDSALLYYRELQFTFYNLTREWEPSTLTREQKRWKDTLLQTVDNWLEESSTTGWFGDQDQTEV